IKATVIGYDLKEDVVRHCNETAEKYGYENLKFYVNDVTKGELFEGDVDMVITLHACDIATDFALHHAISHKVPHIFSVPCCQHEVNNSIHKGGDFDILLSHGLIKERFSALLTDSIRAEILRKCGYETDVIEFVDFAHSPKNLMLRCRLKKPLTPDLSDVKELMEKYRFTQKLAELL
ncbi:MAG: methyltransferase, partial [Clostridia bacterium]|nr:methyltransferase [Clostridia bacterium]